MLIRPGTKGQGLLEYGFIIIIVAILLIAAVYFLGLGIQDLYRTIINSI
jgi:Flp pilus assembly pilin Flp